MPGTSRTMVTGSSPGASAPEPYPAPSPVCVRVFAASCAETCEAAVTVTVCASFQLSGVNARLSGSTVRPFPAPATVTLTVLDGRLPSFSV